MKVTFTIPGAPQGKARPRVTSHGTFTPKKTKDYERQVIAQYRAQCGGIEFEDRAISVSILALYQVPQSKSKLIKSKMLDGSIRPKVKPDADNLAKAVLDALNGIAYKDDAQIVELTVQKWYSASPAVHVMIEEARTEGEI